MSKECVINQFFELGDILFIEPIYRHYHNQGYTVVAPVNKEYLWIQEYIPYVQFKDKASYPYNYEVVEQPEDGRLHLPLRFAHPLYRGYDLHYGDDRANWMRDKYLYLGLDEDLWRTMKLQRNTERESKLFDHLGVNVDTVLRGYNFVNPHFGGSFERVNITIPNDLPVVEMRKVEGFTMLDWLGVIEQAENIFTIETSLSWVIEALEMDAEEYHLYPRYPFIEDVNYIKSYMKNKPWIFHDSTNL